MKSTDLMIGCWVTNAGGFNVKVTSPMLCDFDNRLIILNPIHITEEILLKCGFLGSGLYYVKDQVYIYKEYGFSETVFEYRYNYTKIKIQHLHQLQILYFALTGEHLKIEL